MTKNTLSTHEGITFRTAEFEKFQYDNISCNEQVLNFEPVKCNRICFLGSAEWGSFFEPVRFWNTKGEMDEVNLGLSNHAFEIIYDEKIAWMGKSVMMNDGEVIVYQPEAKIFFVSCEMSKEQEISRIQLPSCTNMHIFAITLVFS